MSKKSMKLGAYLAANGLSHVRLDEELDLYSSVGF